MASRPFKFPKQRMFRQKTDHDCSVPVFSALTGIPEDQICRELPLAPKQGVTVEGWMEWLKAKGLEPLKRQGCPDDIVPCAHLVGPSNPQGQLIFTGFIEMRREMSTIRIHPLPLCPPTILE